MVAKFAHILLPLAAASIAGSACAMTASPNALVDCQVIGGADLPAETGGPDAFCAAIKHAAVSRLPDVGFTVELRVRGPSALTATITTADGTVLPEQRFSISDRGLTRGSLERFAQRLVGEVARAASPQSSAT